VLSQGGIGMESGRGAISGEISQIDAEGSSNRLRTMSVNLKLEPDLPVTLLARRRGEGIV